MKNLLFELYTSFLRIKGFSLSVISVFFALIAFYFTPENTIHIKILVPICLFSFLVFAVITDFAIRAYKNCLTKLPKVISAKKPPALYPNAIVLLLLSKSELFGHESIVSVYFQEDGFEILIGVGFVLTIQQDGLIQVLILKKIDFEKEHLWSDINANNNTILKKLLVKPTIPKQIIEIGG